MTPELKRFVTHLRGTRNVFYVNLCIWTLFVLLTRALPLALKSLLTLEVIFICVGGGVLLAVTVSLIYTTADFIDTEKVRKLLANLIFQQAGIINIRFIDEYTGWTRFIRLTGTFENKEIEIRHHYKREPFKSILFLDIYLDIGVAYYKKVGELRVEKNLSPGTISTSLRNACL